MGKSDADRLDFWTKEEYDKFIATIEKDSRYYVIFEILFWTGCRIGELLALTLQDIDFKSNQINIRKTYYRINRKDVITTPKTEQSIRTIDIPEFLAEEIKNYVNKFYKLPENERLFPIVTEAIQHKLKRHCVKAGVKRIRLHSLRQQKVNSKAKILLSFLQKIFYFPFDLYAIFFKNIDFINKEVY